MAAQQWDQAKLFADIHASRRPWKNRPDIKGDLQFALAQILVRCRETGSPLILAGDIFDSTVGVQNVVSDVQQWLEQVLRCGIPVAYVLGNHDPVKWLATTSSLQERLIHFPEDVANGLQLRLGDHLVSGADYGHRAKFQEMVSNIPEMYSVFVCHQRFGDAFRFDGAQGVLDDFPQHVKYVLAGDIHKRFISRNAKGQTLVYPGSPYATSVVEFEDGGGWNIGVNNDGSLLFTEENLIRRVEVHWLLDGDHEIPSLVDEIGELQRQTEVRMDGFFGEYGYSDYWWAENVRIPLVALKFFSDELPDAPQLLQEAYGDALRIIPMPMDRETQKVMSTIHSNESLDRQALMTSSIAAFTGAVKQPEAVTDLVGMLIDGEPSEDVIKAAADLCDVSEEELHGVG